jgi:hypothetical protein
MTSYPRTGYTIRRASARATQDRYRSGTDALLFHYIAPYCAFAITPARLRACQPAAEGGNCWRWMGSSVRACGRRSPRMTMVAKLKAEARSVGQTFRAIVNKTRRPEASASEPTRRRPAAVFHPPLFGLFCERRARILRMGGQGRSQTLVPAELGTCAAEAGSNIPRTFSSLDQSPRQASRQGRFRGSEPRLSG